MEEGTIIDRTLSKNGIKHFIIRIDFMPNSRVDFSKIINSISESADRLEKRIKSGVVVNVINGKSNVTNIKSEDLVLINDTTNVSLTFSQDPLIILFETRQYLDNTTYESSISSIVAALTELNPDVLSKRIGMRYINEYQCANLKSIQKIYRRRIAQNIEKMADQEFISRVIGQEEYNYSNLKLRVQYGVPNKYYPGTLKNYDLLLDIDAFDDTQHKLDAWEPVLTELNHAAYKKFIDTINPKFLEEMI